VRGCGGLDGLMALPPAGVVKQGKSFHAPALPCCSSSCCKLKISDAHPTARAAESLNEKVDGLRRGSGPVLERDHHLIIGYNDTLMSLLDQLCQGYELSGGTTVSTGLAS